MKKIGDINPSLAGNAQIRASADIFPRYVLLKFLVTLRALRI